MNSHVRISLKIIQIKIYMTSRVHTSFIRIQNQDLHGFPCVDESLEKHSNTVCTRVCVCVSLESIQNRIYMDFHVCMKSIGSIFKIGFTWVRVGINLSKKHSKQDYYMSSRVYEPLESVQSRIYMGSRVYTSPTSIQKQYLTWIRMCIYKSLKKRSKTGFTWVRVSINPSKALHIGFTWVRERITFFLTFRNSMYMDTRVCESLRGIQNRTLQGFSCAQPP